ncbi:D-alanyl-D-alanine carboxypeptidase family protein [Qingshengfaniella alkalisoli]|uniref:serine-type D-Ala-D-Ala carboxypeptidase n=1 Tax=Qingshengfaniella alkalisoli TaxID=2599296 RepID=A0A5B8IX71_9RHOB|nr:D-alanyl-D-alanine carboxypeptidase family protein [Qingshengfaniella alkalisoli]QDY70203.1 D-alanyl-D-alanine carboxypeptidase [Qingshengfaniella alkalisoli]
MPKLARILILSITGILTLTGGARAFETEARAAYVLDLTTNTVLLSKNADEPLPPASMSKLMTVYMLFDALRDNPNVSMDTKFVVSTRARQMGGSTMFLNERDRPTVEDLVQGIIVQSGNDATVVVAEGLAGSEDAFARMMNERAKTLGMEHSTFANASGWPHPNQRMSMHDLVILSSRLITEFPEYYGYFGQAEFEFDGRAPDNRHNRNPLLGLGIGADGLKTGHTQESGYGLVGSAKQGDRRVVFAITGLDSEAAREQEAEKIINWSFRQFVEMKIADEGERLAQAPVWMGDVQQIGLVAPHDLSVLTTTMSQEEPSLEIVYNSPIEAPIEEGSEVAELVVTREGLPDTHLPLIAERGVDRGGFVPRLRSAGHVLAGRVAVAVKEMF